MSADRILFLDEDQPHTLHMAGALIRHGYQADILSAVSHSRPPYHCGALSVMTAPPAGQEQYLDAVDGIVERRSYQHHCDERRDAPARLPRRSAVDEACVSARRA